jgi:hypothetical protein
MDFWNARAWTQGERKNELLKKQVWQGTARLVPDFSADWGGGGEDKMVSLSSLWVTILCYFIDCLFLWGKKERKCPPCFPVRTFKPRPVVMSLFTVIIWELVGIVCLRLTSIDSSRVNPTEWQWSPLKQVRCIGQLPMTEANTWATRKSLSLIVSVHGLLALLLSGLWWGKTSWEETWGSKDAYLIASREQQGREREARVPMLPSQAHPQGPHFFPRGYMYI